MNSPHGPSCERVNSGGLWCTRFVKADSMRRSSIRTRLRLILASLFLFSSLAISPGASAQTTNFQLTWVYFNCGGPARSLDYDWITTDPISRIVFDYYAVEGGPITETYVESTNFTPVDYYHFLVNDFSPEIVVVTVEMDSVPVDVYQYTVAMPGPAFCGVGDVGGSISGGYVPPLPPPPPDVTISITNATCTGFDWAVTATADVVAYVSVRDSDNQGMITEVPRVGANLGGSESYVVATETQTNFTILVYVVDITIEDHLDMDFLEMDCPLPVPSETPTDTPDATSTETPSATSTVTPTTTVTPDVTATGTAVQTPTVGVVEGDNLLIIQIEMPNGESIEGAPYEIYAPEASQLSGGRYRNGTVGANNIIRELDLIEGHYRVVIEPPGFEVIDFNLVLSTAPVTELLAVVHDDATVTVTERQVTQPLPTAVPTNAVPADGVSSTSDPGASAPTGTGGSVTGLPSTGSGDSSVIPRLFAVALITALAGLLSVAVVRRSGSLR